MRDVITLHGMDGMEYLAKAPDGEAITGMILLKGNIYVSTEKYIYKLVDDKRLEPAGPIGS